MKTSQKKKNANGMGSISEYTTPNGHKRYRGMITVGYTMNGNAKRKTFTDTSLSTLKKKMKEFQAKMTLNLLPTNSDFTVSQWFYTWLFEFRVNDLKKSSFERYEGIYRNYIKDTPLGNKKLTDLKGHDLQSYYNKLLNEGISAYTLKTVNKYLGTCLNAAIKHDYINKNYCKAVTLPVAKSKVSRVSFTLLEQQLFLQRISHHKHEALFYLALATGMRQGELLALTWSDINFDENSIAVYKSFKKVLNIDSNNHRQWTETIQTTKTSSGNRTVYVPITVMQKLIEHRNRQEILKRKNADIYEDNNLVFCTQSGTYIDARNLLRSYKHVLVRSNIDYKPFHCLRHTCATRLFEKNISVKTVQTLLGHKDIATTMNIYTHVMPQKLSEDINVLNDLF
ncbi:MAG: tyrosine-type recombinase/integrase [Cellulosilyticaceae bacterium]